VCLSLHARNTTAQFDRNAVLTTGGSPLACISSLSYFLRKGPRHSDCPGLLERFGGRLAIRASKFEPKADHTIWRVGGIYKSRILGVEAKNEGTLREQ